MTALTVDEAYQLQDELLTARAKLHTAAAEILRLDAKVEQLQADLESASRSYNLALEEVERLRETCAAHEGLIYSLGGRP